MIAEIKEKYDSILVLDTGIELRQPLTIVKRTIVRQGYFFVTQSNFIGKKTVQGMFDFFETDIKLYTDAPFCAGGLQGYISKSVAAEHILENTVH